MKTFKELKSLLEAPGAPAADNTLEKDDEQEVKGYKPRSKGEEEFANQHMVTKMPHPVATDAQFTGDIPKGDPEGHVGGKKHAGGESVTKQGSSDEKPGGTAKQDPRTQGRPGEKSPVMQGSSKVR